MSSTDTTVMDPVIAEFADGLRRRLASRLRRVTLFGSRARGQATKGSDYDFLVVVDRLDQETEEAVLDLRVHALDRHEALLSVQLLDEADWALEQGLPFALNIVREGIPL